jgi:hypothetical protein
MAHLFSRERAESIVEDNTKFDDGWTYTIEQWGRYWVVAVHDEDGEPLGYL